MHRVRPFKYKNKCELFDNVLEKEKMDRIMANKRFVLREKVIDIFHEILYIPTTKQCDFIFFHVSILGSMECGKTRNDCFSTNVYKIYKVRKRLCRKIQRNNWCRNTESTLGCK